MKSRPILFSGPMVRALLAGTKTQTRRIIKPQPIPVEMLSEEEECGANPTRQTFIEDGKLRMPGHYGSDIVPCPYGAKGDQLWVREAWAKLLHTSPSTNEPFLCDGDKLIDHATRRASGKGWNYDGEVIAYRATSDVEFCDGDGFSGDNANRDDMPRWKPSIHMRREHSRITLGITDVRVERLNEISEADAKAEGIEASPHGGWKNYLWHGEHDAPTKTVEGWAHQFSTYATDPVGSYSSLWESINGPGSWAANPWVWVLTFKRVEDKT